MIGGLQEEKDKEEESDKTNKSMYKPHILHVIEKRRKRQGGRK